MSRAAFLACAVAVAMASGFAQAQALVVDARAPRYAFARGDNRPLERQPPDAKDVAMPWLHGGRPGVAARINDALFLQVLSTIAPRTPGSTFGLPSTEVVQDFCSIGFEVARNDDRVLSIRMLIEARGQGHCSNAGYDVHFDAATGRQLGWTDLFTPTGRAALLQRRSHVAIEAYSRALATLPPDPDEPDPDAEPDAPSPLHAAAPAQARPADPDHPDDEQRRFFKDCISRWELVDPHAPLEIELAADGVLRLPFWSCAGDNRNEWPIDVQPEPLPIPSAELEPLLTDYGRRLLLGKGMAAAPTDLFGQTLHGHVGTAPVTLFLGKPGGDAGEIEAFYAYDRIGTAITLYGTPKGGEIDLREGDGKSFTLRQVGATLTGTWHGGGRTLPVHLE